MDMEGLINGARVLYAAKNDVLGDLKTAWYVFIGNGDLSTGFAGNDIGW